MYEDRMEAAGILADLLKKFKKDPVLLLAVPRGGVPIAYVIAVKNNFKVDLVLTKKIGHPMNKEYAIGAISLTDSVIIPHKEVPESYIQSEIKRIRPELEKTYHKFMGDQKPASMEGKTLIIIDDGIATGNTLLASVKMLKKSKPDKTVIAVPVAPESTIMRLSKEVDEIICPMIPDLFRAVGNFYKNFTQVSDEEVMFYLNKLKERGLVGTG